MTPPAQARAADGDTRSQLLQAAAGEIHAFGFQAASLSRILQTAAVTKGALYHYFASKRELGYAVLDEVFAPAMRQVWVEPLRDCGDDPLEALIAIIEKAGADLSVADVLHGCPINNLAQEMSPVDDGFRIRIEHVLAEWRDATTQALARGKERGFVRGDTDPAAAATFIVSALEGCIGMAKNAQSHALLMQCGQGLIAYLRSLGTANRGKRS